MRHTAFPVTRKGRGIGDSRNRAMSCQNRTFEVLDFLGPQHIAFDIACA